MLWFDDIHDVIVKNWDASQSNLYTFEQLKNYSQAILPLYLNAVINLNYSPYIFANIEGQKVAHYINEKTNIPIGFIHYYLHNLQNLATNGIIDIEYYNPDVLSIPDAQDLIQKEKTDTKKETIPGFLQVVKSNLIPEIDKNINKILIVGASVAVIYLLGRRII